MSSRSLNRVELIGNLTRDPELKYTPNGTAVCTFGVATNRSWSTNNGDQKEEVQFHRVVAWQKLAELCGKLLTKGKKVYVVGRITYRSFTGKDGTQKSITEIVLDDFIIFDSAKRAEMGEAHTNVKEVTEEKVHEEPVAHEFENATPVDDEKVNPDDIPF
jgi:single-strand DNA-binding protein